MHVLSSVLAVSMVVILLVNGAPLQRSSHFHEVVALDYLRRFGYLFEDGQHQNQSEITKSAIEKFQRIAGLEPSGNLTEETIRQMSKPRCGVKDTMSVGSRFKSVTRWPKKDLTYYISKYSNSRSLTREQIDQEIARAFQVWSDYTDLTFRVAKRHLDERPDIDIKFVSYFHGDWSPFDGRGGILAHAYYPSQGTVHFDDSEPWTVNSYLGVNLFQVAAHEFGHSLGLDHSEVLAALMTPYYRRYQPNFRLDNDDIEGIQYLYGKKTRRVYTGFRSGPTKSLCWDLKFDTIFTDHRDITYVFKGTQYLVLGSRDPPQSAQRKWPGLPDRIDAVFNHPYLAKTYFFSGAHVWRYERGSLDDGYPKRISQRFPGIPDNLDAAFVWPSNNQIYFFKGRQYWKFDYTTLPPVAYEYPRLIREWWLGMPDAPDVVFNKEGRMYFVKGSQFAHIDDNTLRVDSSGYRCTRELFECPNSSACTASLEEKAWMAEIKLKTSTEFDESLQEPKHGACMRHKDCSNIP